jgi:hypothetical protein
MPLIKINRDNGDYFLLYDSNLKNTKNGIPLLYEYHNLTDFYFNIAK